MLNIRGMSIAINFLTAVNRFGQGLTDGCVENAGVQPIKQSLRFAVACVMIQKLGFVSCQPLEDPIDLVLELIKGIGLRQRGGLQCIPEPLNKG